MNVLRSSKPGRLDDILSHWGWAIPILLLAAALSIQQIELYPPTSDEFFSMYNTGWLIDGPYSPPDVIASLRENSRDHTPGYFILLSIWGSLSAYDLALGRVLTIFTALLALAMVYRLGRDFIAPIGGLLVLIIVSSNAFYNFYYAHNRMYPLFVLTAAAVLWCYLRIMYQQKRVKRRDYFALAAAVFAFINIHAFSGIFLLMLGIYHLLIAPKNRRWWRVSAALMVSGLLLLPYLLILVGEISAVASSKAGDAIDGLTAIQSWFTVTFNNQPLLFLLSIIGLVLGIWKKKIRFKPWMLMFLLLLPIIALLAQVTTLVTEGDMRYQLPGWLPLVLFIAAGLYALHRFHRGLIVLVILWVIAGLSFQAVTDYNGWLTHIRGRARAFPLPPWQVLSRMALNAEAQPALIGYFHDALHIVQRLERGGQHIPYSQHQHYFGQHGIALHFSDSLNQVAEAAQESYLNSPVLWLFYEPSTTDSTELTELKAIAAALDYQLCHTVDNGIDLIVLQYTWRVLDCQAPQPPAVYQTAEIDYEFYGATLDTAALHFRDRWTARGDEPLDRYSLSHQLLTADWDKVAQLDLPLVHAGDMRTFAIDIAAVPPGTYRLMVILYDHHTGAKSDWLNASDPPNMLTLTEITIPDPQAERI